MDRAPSRVHCIHFVKNKKACKSCFFGYVPQKVWNVFLAQVTHIPEPFDTV